MSVHATSTSSRGLDASSSQPPSKLSSPPPPTSPHPATTVTATTVTATTNATTTATLTSTANARALSNLLDQPTSLPQLVRLARLPDPSQLPPWEPVCPSLILEACTKARRTQKTVDKSQSESTRKEVDEREMEKDQKGEGGVQCTFEEDMCPYPHFEPIMRPWTDPTLGQCSYLNMCYGDPAFANNPSLAGGKPGSKQCRYQHYRLIPPPLSAPPIPNPMPSLSPEMKQAILESVGETTSRRSGNLIDEPQWLNMDARRMSPDLLGSFDLILADPPWDIHMSLPYGTLSDAECGALPIPALQPTWGLLALWVTGRAMDLGRELFKEWGYRRIDEVVWVKVNQLGGLIRTGRTGHWLNHTSEHLLIALKLPPASEFPDRRAPIPWGTDPRLAHFKRGMDGDVVVSEVRETSRKPDEFYSLLERLAPDARRLEIFGRRHNVRKGWLTIGNQLGDSHIVDPELKQRMNMS